MFCTCRPYESRKQTINIISRVTCTYIRLKHCMFSFIALLIMPSLSEHGRSGTIEMLQAGVRVSDVA